MEPKTEVVKLEDVKRGDDVTFHFVEEAVNKTENGTVDFVNTPKGTCVIRTGPEAVRIMNDWFLIVRRPKPVPPKPKKKKILEKYFFDIHDLNKWWNENDIEIISINSHQSASGNRNTVVYYYEK